MPASSVMPSSRVADLADARRVRERAVLVEAVGHRQRFAVIGDGEVAEAGVARGDRHRFDVVAAVGLGGMRVEVAADVGERASAAGSARRSAASISPRPSRSSGGIYASPSAS